MQVGYGPKDFNKFGMYINKCFKWGYFPEVKFYNEKELLALKENYKINIVWVGRFIKWKHPEDMVKLAKKLKRSGYNFEIKMLGNGPLFDKIKIQITKYNLEKEIKLVGAVKSDKVREYMEKANIFVCTSGQIERWGVVLNEAMNSGCSVIAYKRIGAVPFLIDNNNNGYYYTNFKDLYNKTVELIDNKEKREKFSINAYRTISNIWTAKNATKNLELLINSIINNEENPIKEGPGSNAYPV